MKLVKILSDKVQIRSDYKEFDDVRINDLIAVSDGEVELVTMVNTLTDIDTENEEEIGENDYILEHSSTKMLECSIIGTVKDGTFQKAIDKYPSKGNDVKLLQRLLKSNGFKGKDGKNLTIDGECGTNTVYAIKKYQTKKGLSVDGCAGPATWKSILLR